MSGGHGLSADDRAFRDAFEAGTIRPADFDHRAHLRLAYGYLVERGTAAALIALRAAIPRFLSLHGLPQDKYHETLTEAWVLALRHFMERSAPAASAAEFIERNPALLDSRIMLTHYSPERLYSATARAQFIEPDLQPIPRHGTRAAGSGEAS